MAASIDLAEVRDARDAAVRLGRAMAERMSQGIAARTADWADRAFAISGPLLSTDPDAALAVNRWAARRLRSEIRRTLGRDMPDAGRQDILLIVEQAFVSRLVALAEGCPQVDGGRM